MGRDPTRAIPELPAPTLQALGLTHLEHVAARTRWLFLSRPVVAATAAATALAIGHPLIALAVTPLWFGWTMTLLHHMTHGSLGGTSRLRHLALFFGSLLILHSGHAIRVTHLQHHRPGLDEPDPEGEIENVPWCRLPLAALRFRYKLILWALRDGGRSPSARHARPWILAETGAAMVALTYALTHLHHHAAWLILAVWFGDVIFAALLSKGPHTNYGRPTPTPLIAVRAGVGRWLMLAQHWHLEHHLYPHVLLPRLAPLETALEDFLSRHDALIKRVP